jgi:hypothetical protein
LEQALERAKNVVEGWGGKMYFAYLPATERYRFPEIPEIESLSKDQAEVVKIVTHLDIPIIDLDVALSATKNPAQLFPRSNWPVHLTEEGYRVISKYIATQLRGVSTRH